MSRADYRSLMVDNTVALFHLVTIHAYRPGASSVALRYQTGSTDYGDPLPMVSEGNGWWRRMVPSETAIRFTILVSGKEGDGNVLETTAWEVWERDGELLPTPPLTTVRVHADVGYGHAVFVRGASWPLSWEVGEPAAWNPGDVWTLELAGVVSPLEVKVLIDDATWESGANHAVEPGDTVDIAPVL